MSARPKKRSLTLRGHRTSVSLEDLFWDAFRAIAAREGKPINVLAAEIDAERDLDAGLASAIRLHILADALSRARKDEVPLRRSRSQDQTAISPAE